MTKQILRCRFLAIILFVSANAFAHGGGGHGGGGFHGSGHHGHGGHYYHGGRWHSGWGWGGVATVLVIGAIVASLPPDYDTVYVSGVPYYYNNIYYRPASGGYVVVRAPY